MTSKEQLAHPPRRKPEENSVIGLGKSLLEKISPDNAGPLLLPDEAAPVSDSTPERKSMDSSQIQHSKDKRPPLHETTPNSSPPKALVSKNFQPGYKTSPLRSPSSVRIADNGECNSNNNDNNDNDDDTLGPAISSLLSHHQAARSSNTVTASKSATTSSHAAQPTSNSHHGRRRRQLLGRAPSNLSSHSIKPSRASSVDTLNTDGLGTPLEATHTHSHSLSSNNAAATTTTTAKANADGHPTFPSNPIFDHDADHDPDRPSQEHLQMTQLGYADPHVTAWRERVALKMAAGGAAAAKGAPLSAEGKKSTVAAENVIGKDGHGGGGGAAGTSLGISKRTRLAVGSRGAKTVI